LFPPSTSEKSDDDADMASDVDEDTVSVPIASPGKAIVEHTPQIIHQNIMFYSLCLSFFSPSSKSRQKTRSVAV
jgi:hypothetical protein